MNKWLKKIYRRLISDKISEVECLIKLFYNLYTLNLRIPLFPDGFSGNASFLYAVFKLIYIGKPKHILELGSGQSTLLLNKIQQKLDFSFEITSVEHDESWFQNINVRLSLKNHDYLYTPLKQKPFHSKKYYDLPSEILDTNAYDMIIIDGPPRGLAKRSDILHYIKQYGILTKDFMVLIDDTEKKSEFETCKTFRAYFAQQHIEVNECEILGRKHQHLFVGGKYSFMVNV